MLNIVKDISTVLSLFVVIVTIITVTIPNLRGKLISWLTKTSNTNENINEIKEMLSKHIQADVAKQKTLENHNDALQCMLRDNITSIYFKHLKDGQLHTYEHEDLTRLYEAYIKLNGNSYVKQIYEQMTTEWNRIP